MKKLVKNNAANVNNTKQSIFSIRSNRKLIAILVLIIAIGMGLKIFNIVLSNQGLGKDKYSVLNLGTNINKINAKGEVKSENAINVYSDLNLIVKAVRVKVGDEVKAKDVLAVLDTRKLEEQISELEANISATDANNEIELTKAKLVYESTLDLKSDEKNESIKSAKVALNAAKLDFENKKRIYENSKALFGCGSISEQNLRECEISYKNAKNIFDKCTVDLNNIKAKVQLDFNIARSNYDSIRAKFKDNSQRIVLDNLKKDLKNAAITSPVNGIISMKNASVGNLSSGVLFEIKDKNNITVNVNVKEVDIGKIKKGQRAEIKCDATGANIVKGEVISVQQIATVEDNNFLNLNNDSNDKEAEFEVKIKVIDPNCKLKIGMKAQADIILAEKHKVFTVPSESVIKDKDNNDCLYIADKQGKDYVVKQIPITKGTETDVNVEVFGTGLKDNIIVLNNPSDYEVGSIIKIKGK